MKKKVLLICPPYRKIYKETKIKAGAPFSPLLNLAAIAAQPISEGHEVKLLDLNIENSTREVLEVELESFSPDLVAITFATPLFFEVQKIISIVKNWKRETQVVLGGPHVSADPVGTMGETQADIAAVGEGDFCLSEILSDAPLSSIKGILFRENGDVRKNQPRPYLENLDKLLFPAWEIYDLSKYTTTDLLAERSPAGYIETSRGCLYGCVYCNKHVFGRNFRTKSPERVVDEMERMIKLGFKEIHIAEDAFTTDMQRAATICDEIIRRKLDFPWVTLTGIRVDSVDFSLLKKMKDAGCYRVLFGIESGSDEILKRIRKGIRVEQVRQAVEAAKRAGLEVFGAFMFALPGETEKTMQKTIDLAVSLDLDLAKASITIPLPGTPLFQELQSRERIKTNDWSKFNFYFPAKEVYDHDNLDWETVERYFTKFYRRFYLRPEYIYKRFLRSLRKGRVLSDVKSFVRTRW